MKSINRVELLGHVTAEPEVKPVKNDIKVAKFTLATSEGGYTKKDGTQVPESTQFHRIVAWRGNAEYIEKFIHKGDAIVINGSIEYSEVVIGADGKASRDPNAQGTKVRYTDIVADEVILVHAKNGIPTQQPQQQPQPMQQPYNGYPQQQPWGGQQPMQQPMGGYPQYPPQYVPQPQNDGWNGNNNGNAPF